MNTKVGTETRCVTKNYSDTERKTAGIEAAQKRRTIAEKQAEIDAIRNEMAAQIRVLEAEMAALAAEDSTLTEVAATGQAMADVECDVYETETHRVVVLKGGMPSDHSQIIESVYITPPQPPQQEA